MASVPVHSHPALKTGLKCLCPIIALLIPPSQTVAEAPLRFGVVPQQSASVTLSNWSRFSDALEAELGRDVDVLVAPDIPTFEACLEAEAFDLAYMNPFHYVFFRERRGYAAIAHRHGPGLRGLVVVRADDGPVDLQDLDGQRIAFPSAAAFGASLLIRGTLDARGIDFTPVYVKSHESTFRAVAAGVLAAGGAVRRTLANAPAALKGQLTVLYETGVYTPHAFAVAMHVGPEERARLAAAILHVSDNSPDALAPLRISALQAAGPGAYADVAALNITAEMAGLDDLEGRACPFE